jgi:RimJ/RimL family protein N-acetyltransferase
VLRPSYPILTERLSLRPLTDGDLDDVHAYYSRPEVTRYLYWGTRDRDGSREALDDYSRYTALESEGDGLVLAMVARDGGRVVGQVSLHWDSEEHRQGEIGFVVNPDYHGRGLAREAAMAMLRLGFDDLGLHRITGRCDARNLASARLMERLGMRREAHLVENEFVKGEWTDELVFAMLEQEWRAIRAARSE